MKTKPKRYLSPSLRAMESANAAFLVGHLLHEKIVNAGLVGVPEWHGARNLAFQVGLDIILKDWCDQGAPRDRGEVFVEYGRQSVLSFYSSDKVLPPEGPCRYFESTPSIKDNDPGGMPCVGPKPKTVEEFFGDRLGRGLDLAVFETEPTYGGKS
jgi:hypothetical protein